MLIDKDEIKTTDDITKLKEIRERIKEEAEKEKSKVTLLSQIDEEVQAYKGFKNQNSERLKEIEDYLTAD